jgi:general secretion pathway protein G
VELVCAAGRFRKDRSIREQLSAAFFTFFCDSQHAGFQSASLRRRAADWMKPTVSNLGFRLTCTSRFPQSGKPKATRFEKLCAPICHCLSKRNQDWKLDFPVNYAIYLFLELAYVLLPEGPMGSQEKVLRRKSKRRLSSVNSPAVSLSVHKEKPAGEGFTFVELLIAITIAGALAAIAVQWYQSYRDQSNINRTITDMRSVDTQIQLYRQANDSYPSSLGVVPQGNIVDPWGNPFQYLLIEGNTKAKGNERKDKSLVPINSDYDLYSMGADGKTVAPLTAQASQDDIIRANNGAYFGPASDY